MKTKFFLFCLLLAVNGSVFAKDIIGKVVDDAGISIPYANVMLLQFTDSTLISGTVTSDEGAFKISSQKQKEQEKGILRITCVGYADKTIDLSLTTSEMQTIVLSKGKVLLKEVTVIGRAQPIQMKAGSVVANIANSVLSKEMNVIDVLRKIPGMTVTKGELTSFVGGDPIIYINKRKVRSMTEVKQLAVKDIKSIELNTNPGSEYDASTGAVLLIVTKKKLEGLSVQLEQELRKNHALGNGEGAKLNYNKGGMNAFATFRYDDYRKRSNQDMAFSSFAPDTTWHQTENTYSKYFSGKSYSYASGVDYAINDKHSVGIKYDGLTEILNVFSPSDNTLYANSNLYAKILGGSDLYDKSLNNHVNAYYSGKLNDKLKLSLYADYAHSDMKRNQITTENSSKFGHAEVKSHSKSDYYLYAVNPTVEYSLSKGQLFTIGSELNRVDGKSNLVYDSSSLSNSKTSTRENKFAGYLSYSFKKNSFSANAGLRYENVHSTFNDDFDSSKDINRNYSNLFPSLGLSYIQGAFSQSLTYRTSTIRPPFSRLNNDAYYANRFQLQVGNPNLVPQISNNVQYSLMYKSLYFTLGYTHVKDYISSYMFSDAKNPAIVTYSWKNFDKQQNIKAVINLQHRFGFYEPSVTGKFSKDLLKVETINGEVTAEKPLMSFNINNYFHLPSKYLFNFEYEYDSKYSHGIYTFNRAHIINLSIQKSFMKDALQLSFSANDLLRNQINVYSGSIANITFWQREDQDNRSCSFNLVYRFNNYKKEYKGRSAAESELNRL